MNELNFPYQVVPGNGYCTVKLIGDCDSFAKSFEAEVNALLSQSFPFVIINCEHLSSISKDWIRVLLNLHLGLKKNRKGMRFIQVSPSLKQMFKKEGMDAAFKISPSLRDALVEFGLVTKKMLDTDFINPFLSATMHVLNVQASISAESGQIYLKKQEDQFRGDVSGVIGIVSESFNGSVIISFPEETFLKVMSAMLGEEQKSINKDILDGAGEITNMIFGQAKIVLNEKGYGIKTALPSVVSGKNHTLSTLTDGPVIVVPFKSQAGNFFVEICLSS